METIQASPQQTAAPAQGEKNFVFQPPKKSKKWIKRGVILLAVGAGLFFFVLRPMMGAGRQMTQGAYLANTAQMQDLDIHVSGTGTVTPIESYRVAALVTGEVIEAPFEESQWVEKGDLLYRIDAGDAETSVAQTQLSVRQAQLNLDNLTQNLRPSASANGVVQQVLVQKGDMVGAGTPIAEVADTSSMTVTLPFQSADAALLSVGQPASVVLSGTLETLPGTIVSISSAELVGNGGALVRQVKIAVTNPGALTADSAATATVGELACAGSGQFEAAMRQTVMAQTSGEVTQVHVTAGSRVSPGTALATLGGASVNTAVENARISLENAQLSLQRAQDVLENYIVTAPISGTVIEKNFKVGDKIESESLSAAGGNLAIIYDMSTLSFDMSIDELDISKISVGQTVEITADALGGKVFSGYVDKVNINGTTVGGVTTYPVTVMLQETQGLLPGMNVSASVLIEQVGKVLCIPIDAVQRGNLVLVAGPGALGDKGELIDPSKLEEREVAVGRNSDTYIEILDGLAEGETVFIHNAASSAMSAMVGRGG